MNTDRGQIKHAGGFRPFALRGIAQRNAEWQLVGLTHNLLKLWRAAPASSACGRNRPRGRFTEKPTQTRLPQLRGRPLAYLPPYSPDLNPIERLFSKLKSRLRKHAERTRDSLWNRIGQLVPEFRPDECRNDLRHCGYTAN